MNIYVSLEHSDREAWPLSLPHRVAAPAHGSAL